jgi:ribonucleoside-diphosphate reductase beta chain
MNLQNKVAKELRARRIVGGTPSKFMAIRPTKYRWAEDVLEQMRNNDWHEREVDLTEDAKQYATGLLTGGNLTAFKRSLAFLSNLDGIQVNNLALNINRYITAPEVSLCLTRQAWEETIHLLAYGQIIESVGMEPAEIWWMFEQDKKLRDKNGFILQQSQIVGEEFSIENFIKAVAANVLLEGVYFFSGFLTFYTLERDGLMKGAAKEVKFIQRDETAHLNFFVHMWKTLQVEYPEYFTPELLMSVRDIFELGVEIETDWGRYVIEEGVFGLTDSVINDFIRYLAGLRMTSLGLENIYAGVKNPVPWFESASRIGGEENFFETKVTAYAADALEW